MTFLKSTCYKINLAMSARRRSTQTNRFLLWGELVAASAARKGLDAPPSCGDLRSRRSPVARPAGIVPLHLRLQADPPACRSVQSGVAHSRSAAPIARLILSPPPPWCSTYTRSRAARPSRLSRISAISVRWPIRKTAPHAGAALPPSARSFRRIAPVAADGAPCGTEPFGHPFEQRSVCSSPVPRTSRD